MPICFEMWRRPLIMLLFWAGILLPTAAGQLPKAATPEPAPVRPPAPEDPLGRGTPHGTVVGFLSEATNGNFRAASLYLDSNLRPTEREQLARQLKYVIDRGLSIDPKEISRDPQGELGDDGRPSTRLLLGSVRDGPDSLDIYLHRVTRGPGPPLWLFSAHTLKGIPEFAERVKPSWLETYVDPLLPDWFGSTTALSLPLTRWIHGLLMLMLGVFGIWFLSAASIWGFERVYRLATQRTRSARELRLLWPLRFLGLLIIVSIFARLATTLVGRQAFGWIQGLLVIVGLVWLGIRVTDAFCDLAARRTQQAVQTGRLAVIQLARGTTKALLVIAGVLAALSHSGVNLSTVVAGLGIGGVAVAFAAQKTIENLFGTITFVTDPPARVGDFCRIGEFVGTIESVGLRSSRIRTIEDTVLTVPNGQLSTMTLDNISARGKILFRHTVGLSYSTTSDQLSAVLNGMEDLLRNHQRVEAHSFRVRLIKFGGSSLDVELFAYVLTRDWVEFLSIQQGLLVRILQIVEANGTSIAFPSQTLYFANQPPGN